MQLFLRNLWQKKKVNTHTNGHINGLDKKIYTPLAYFICVCRGIIISSKPIIWFQCSCIKMCRFPNTVVYDKLCLYFFFGSFPFYYTPGIYAEGFIVFAFPFVCLTIRTSVMFVEFTTKFFTELQDSFSSEVYLTNHSLIRKHSYLDHRYPGKSTFIPWLLTPGSMPQGGARGQNLRHL